MLQEKSLVVSLTVSKWTASKHDRKITDEVRDSHNASNDAGRYNKRLVAKEKLEAIQKIESAARNYHYEITLPWGKNGERLLPSTNYLEYVAKLMQFQSEFETAVSDFVAQYPGIVEEAKVRLNGMFRQQDYPSPLDIRSKFDFKTTFMPVPEEDFRVSLSDNEITKLKNSVNSEMTSRINEAVKDTWNRIKDQLVRMKDRLGTPDAIFKNSLFDNLASLIDLLPKLNVTNDENISKICTEMSSLLVDPEAVRNNSNLRSEKADQVDLIMNKFGEFFS